MNSSNKLTIRFCLAILNKSKLSKISKLESSSFKGKKLLIPGLLSKDNKFNHALANVGEAAGMIVVDPNDTKKSDLVILTDSSDDVKKAWRSLDHSGSIVVVNTNNNTGIQDKKYVVAIGSSIFMNTSIHGFSINNLTKDDFNNINHIHIDENKIQKDLISDVLDPKTLKHLAELI